MSDTDRTTVEDAGDADAVEIEGVRERSVFVDYYEDQPRLIVHADPDREEPTHVIDLPEE